MKEEVGNDDELLYCVDQAVALDGLHLSLLEKTVAERLRPVLIRIADEAAVGNRPVSAGDRVLDSKSQLQFQNSTAELASMLKRRESDT
ncbi:hypothetical protein G6O69_19165 [Pseudenhygromyxa sp. WMMC2535]|uniref:hypothetical protein n=1 Tax=Pseudenhygromyxa sp. WMMC2535 TaxID=2712867 RepID=UPI00155248A1|nr:hypothetical protein [Pseudenhygromyxa sp. WMMC2535]NVB39973.1 hypothetical protein [Pseudenhygromyxa sp. WMMC2535]